ncbi:MAG: protein-export chaperone SecB [Pseudomonadota bacterium]
MSDTPQGSDGQAGQPQQSQPSLRVLAQYLKDLSFENPKAPAVFRQGAANPNIEVNVDVGARTFSQNNFEVELSVSARAMADNEAVFVVETTYGGAFEITGIPQDQLEAVLLVECPRLLFPFVRQIVAETTQSGNFPPVMLDPIDFFAIYERRKMQEAGAQSATA